MSALRWLIALLCISVMSFIPFLSGAASATEHALIVKFNYGYKDLNKLFELEDKLKTVISNAGVGEYDGNEIAIDGKDGSLYMYGQNADNLYKVVKPILEATPFMKGAKVKLRYGPPKDGVREKIYVINP